MTGIQNAGAQTVVGTRMLRESIEQQTNQITVLAKQVAQAPMPAHLGSLIDVKV
ncbi:MAG: hypothetical protein VKN33_05715 [Candidatus Sericytochromatia bacterium]|nr:hypothetical protein [Candidatus Sericytochromatia bacterium]